MGDNVPVDQQVGKAGKGGVCKGKQTKGKKGGMSDTTSNTDAPPAVTDLVSTLPDTLPDCELLEPTNPCAGIDWTLVSQATREQRVKNIKACSLWSSFLTSCEVTSEEGNLHFGTSPAVEDMVEDLQTWAEFVTKVAPPELDEFRTGRTSTSLQSDGSGNMEIPPVATVDSKGKTARARALHMLDITVLQQASEQAGANA